MGVIHLCTKLKMVRWWSIPLKSYFNTRVHYTGPLRLKCEYIFHLLPRVFVVQVHFSFIAQGVRYSSKNGTLLYLILNEIRLTIKKQIKNIFRKTVHIEMLTINPYTYLQIFTHFM